MRSKISIEIDFQNGNLPVIQILSRKSDDVRDNLIQSFLQGLWHSSRWCTIQYKESIEEVGGGSDRWYIQSLTPTVAQLEEEIKLMQALLDKVKQGVEP